MKFIQITSNPLTYTINVDYIVRVEQAVSGAQSTIFLSDGRIITAMITTSDILKLINSATKI